MNLIENMIEIEKYIEINDIKYFCDLCDELHYRQKWHVIVMNNPKYFDAFIESRRRSQNIEGEKNEKHTD